MKTFITVQISLDNCTRLRWIRRLHHKKLNFHRLKWYSLSQKLPICVLVHGVDVGYPVWGGEEERKVTLSRERGVERVWFRDGSRTSPRRGRQSLGGRQPNILVLFSEKPYEIKEILVRRGARAGCAPPKSATVRFAHLDHMPTLP